MTAQYIPVMRKALAYKYLMENRKPIIGDDSLIAGTTTSKKVGCPLYPEGSAVIIWNELITMPHRTYNPFDISEETRELLHNDIFVTLNRDMQLELIERAEYGI